MLDFFIAIGPTWAAVKNKPYLQRYEKDICKLKNSTDVISHVMKRCQNVTQVEVERG